MTDIRTSFAVLEDSSTAAGLPLHKVLENDAVAAKNAQIAFVAKTSGTNLAAFLKVNASTGALFVDTGAPTECLKARGELAAGSSTLALVTGATIPLTAATEYKDVGFIVSSRRDSLFQIVQVDDATETILGEIVVGSGEYTVSSQLHCLSFTAGSTGTQALKIVAKNFEALSSLRASLTVEQVL
jgi:hypothetical protein